MLKIPQEIKSYVDVNELPLKIRKIVIADILQKESDRLADLAHDLAQEARGIRMGRILAPTIEAWSVATGIKINSHEFMIATEFREYI